MTENEKNLYETHFKLPIFVWHLEQGPCFIHTFHGEEPPIRTILLKYEILEFKTVDRILRNWATMVVRGNNIKEKAGPKWNLIYCVNDSDGKIKIGTKSYEHKKGKVILFEGPKDIIQIAPKKAEFQINIKFSFDIEKNECCAGAPKTDG
jgi:hypothetical protein